MKRKFISVLIVSILFFTIGCKKKDKENEPAVEFNKSELLTNVGTNIIVPAYQKLLTDINNLESTYTVFQNSKTSQNLDLIKVSWLTAVLQWNRTSLYEFGPAMEIGLKGAVGTFPTDTNKVLNNIVNGNYTLGSISNVDAIGFSVFDFLLYRKSALNYFISNDNYTNYGLQLIQKMKSEVSLVLNGWNTNYLTKFNSSTGTESTSSFSLLVNEFVKSYEQTKWTKVGIPLGKQSLGIARPEYIEARQSKEAFLILKTNMICLKDLFNGNNSTGTVGKGFDDYLISLEKQDLVNSINTTFSSIISDIDAMNGTFEEVLTNNPSSLDALYTKIHNLTVSLKTDMTSAFGVLITYQDNDGD